MLSASAGWGEVAPSALGRAVPARTDDGGATWRPIVPERGCHDAPGPPGGVGLDDAWLVSSAPAGSRERKQVTVCHSSDGARHWAVVATFEATGFPQVPQFVDAMHGWLTTVVTGGMHSDSDIHLYRTADGGRRWTEVAASVTGIVGGHSFGGLPPMCGGQFQFVTPTTGWYAGGCGQGGAGEDVHHWAPYLAVTHDGGRHWNVVALPHPRVAGGGRAGCLLGAACYFVPVTIRPHVTELYAGGAGAAATVLYRSTDGRTWTVNALPLDTPAVGSFDGVHILQFSDTAPWIYASNDAGHSWQRLDTNIPRPAFEGPYFVSRRTAFAFGPGRALYRTDDGGRAWRHVPATVVGP